MNRWKIANHSFNVDIQDFSRLFGYENSCFYYHSFMQQNLLKSNYVSSTIKATEDRAGE